MPSESHKRAQFQALLFAAVLVLSAPLLLCSCFGLGEPPKVAATVNGDPVYEEDVTEYIEGFRKKNAQYETDEGWVDFLKSNGYTAETLRTYVLNTVFIPRLLIQQQCDQLGIVIGDSELDEVIAQEKAYYEERYGANSWDSVLASYGFDEESWRQNELNRLMEERLRSTVIGEVQPTEAEVQTEANEVASSYNGIDSYYILFPTQEAAREARNRLVRSGEVVSLEEFERIGEEVHAGWNSLPGNRAVLSTEYEQALHDLEPLHASEPVYIDGSWALIFCNEKFNAGDGGESVALSTIPLEIYEQIVIDATERKIDQLFNEWLSNLAEQSNIVIEQMPEGLPYSVASSYVE